MSVLTYMIEKILRGTKLHVYTLADFDCDMVLPHVQVKYKARPVFNSLEKGEKKDE